MKISDVIVVVVASSLLVQGLYLHNELTFGYSLHVCKLTFFYNNVFFPASSLGVKHLDLELVESDNGENNLSAENADLRCTVKELEEQVKQLEEELAGIVFLINQTVTSNNFLMF